MELARLYMSKKKPWLIEPDYLNYKDRGFDCLILRGPSGSLCGYVGIPVKHRACQQEIQNDLEVHGGITFSRRGENNSHHYLKTDSGRTIHWIGFDCAHYNDMIPQLSDLLGRANGIYRDIPFVKKEIERLVDQLIVLRRKKK